LTDTPLPPPLPQPPAPVPPRSRVPTLVAWLVILASAGFIITTTAVEKSTITPDDRPTAAVEFRLAARYAVGVSRIFRGLGAPNADQQAASLLP
jgi:hypothetical protein